MESWQIIVSSLGGSAVVSGFLFGGLLFIAKKWWSTRIDESVKNHYEKERMQIKRDNDIEIARVQAELDGKLEGLKAGYQIAAQEKNIVFSKLHAEQGEVLKKLHTYLVEYDDILRRFDMEVKSDYKGELCRELLDKFMELCKESNTYLKYNSILLPQYLAMETGHFFALAYSGQVSKMLVMESSGDHAPLLPLIEYRENCQKVLGMLEREFRVLLGIRHGYVAGRKTPNSQNEILLSESLRIVSLDKRSE